MPQYERLKVVPLSSVLPLLGEDVKGDRVAVEGEHVHTGGLRLATFKHKGLSCASCGLTGEFFAIERTGRNGPYHLNLYAGNGTLMTHDHILARALGGREDLGNTQTMCSPCNSKKSKHEKELSNILDHHLKELHCGKTSRITGS